MTQSQHLPIYSATYAYAREVYRIKLKLPKSLKHDLGKEIFDSTLKILKCIVLANRSVDKARHLSRLLLETEVQWTITRLLFDLRGMPVGEFKVLSERLSSIEKQAQAWLKWQHNRQPELKSSFQNGKKVWQ